MSFPHNSKLWIATRDDLKNAMLREKVLRTLAPTRDRNSVHRLMGNVYARYIVLCNNLSELYDQTLQVQKRGVIEKILLSSTNRLLELKREMQKIEMSEFVYVDDALVELKLTTQNIEFLRPFYFPRKRDIEVQRVVDEVPKVSSEIVVALKGLDKYRKILTPEEIAAKEHQQQIEKNVNLIKAHEKAKQARIMWLNINQFPAKFRPKPQPFETVKYDFTYLPDQFPLHKIKRTNYKIDFYKPKVSVAKFRFYEPPTYRINKLGHKVIVPRKKSEIVEQLMTIDSDQDSSDVEEAAIAEQIEAEKRLQMEREVELTKIHEAAVLVIQRCFRRYQKRKAAKLRSWKRKELCGIVLKPNDPDKSDLKLINEKMRCKRRERKQMFDETFMKALDDEKARILKMKSEFIMEDITEDIRQWFREFYDGAKGFHRYPEEFEGGTIMVVRGETQTIEEFLIEKNKSPEQKAKEKEQRKKARKSEKKMKKKLAALEKKEELRIKLLEKKQGPTWNFADKKFDSKNLDELEASFRDYQHDWQFIDESINRTEAPIWDWVTTDAYADVHKELRLIVDGFMRIELELLRIALAVDNKTRYELPLHKKPKKSKKKKRKPSVDATEGRSLEECYEELKAMNIIRKYPKRSLDEFIGDQNFGAHEFRQMNKNTIPYYGDIKNNLRSFVLGMGPLELPKVKSLCIAGPPKSGKKLLVEALCTELDAVMFDLSAKNIAPIKNMVEFVPLMMQMAKKLQPTVIFIDGAHKLFIRKVVAEEVVEEPRKLGRFIFKSIVKKLKAEDAIMLMGTTNQPWNCNFGLLRQCFEKFVMLPPTLDYPTALMAWNKGLQAKRINNFDASSLARVTRNYTVGDILDMIDHYVDLRRRMQFHLKPLTSEELLENLLTGPHAKTAIDDKTIQVFNGYRNITDVYFYERTETIARVQIEINKEKEIKAQKQAQRDKKKLKK